MAEQDDQQDHHHRDPRAGEGNGAALFKPDHSIDFLNLCLAAFGGSIRLLIRFNGVKPIESTRVSSNYRWAIKIVARLTEMPPSGLRGQSGRLVRDFTRGYHGAVLVPASSFSTSSSFAQAFHASQLL